jgi:hypothetical protein
MNIGHSRTKSGEIIYADLTPATPLLVWRGFQPKHTKVKILDLPERVITRNLIQRFWPWATGRTWKEAHIRWWFEVHSDFAPKTEDNPFGVGQHHWQYDGGAMTLRQAIWKAHDAVAKAVEEVDEQEVPKA